jgi:hypothetical protein
VEKAIYGRPKLTAANKRELFIFVADHTIMSVDHFWTDIKAIATALHGATKF